ncbi:MAG: hypothetical protein AMQ22_00087 [Candidatus Methanofastidiosum methylothiophilum]|uniref:Uncharacterized protein n=1 Tax=Candidatus Methanofastidiosum methylothiophilum TaxID=1705564 RepID=A0A150J9H5_9EURY|nr:MAG: hypothetical protein AMQ22_00087 [Candidatus Methanofastidiosum methylthiophilus]
MDAIGWSLTILFILIDCILLIILLGLIHEIYLYIK